MSAAATPPEVAVVILSYGPRPTLAAAVRSVVEQDVPAEILVVHSGGGDPHALLAAAGLDVPIVVFPERLYVGGARNAGIERTVAPVVAFLADDCTAEPGWVRERRDAHAAGHVAVASALVAHRPRHATTLAVHLSLHLHRMPAMPAEHAVRYGVSYSRDTLVAAGPFDVTMASGEDSVYNDRLVEHGVSILWAPQIVTVHWGSERLRDALRDGYRRGRRRVLFDVAQGNPHRRPYLRRFWWRMRFARQWIPRVVTADQRWAAIAGVPVYVLCVAASTLGAWREGLRW